MPREPLTPADYDREEARSMAAEHERVDDYYDDRDKPDPADER